MVHNLKNRIYELRTRFIEMVLPKRFHAGDCFLTSAQSDFAEHSDFNLALKHAKDAYEQDGSRFSAAWRLHTLLWAAASAPRGTFVEFGVNKGAMMAGVMAVHSSRIERLYLCDCWDLDYTGTVSKVKGTFEKYCQVKFIVGYMPQMAVWIPELDISFAHFDMNNGKAEVETIELLWPQFASGAIIVIDDYAYPGFEVCQQPWRFSKILPPILSLPTGQGLLIKP